jgi:translocation and assembly module TamB
MLGLSIIGMTIAQWWARTNLAPLVAQELSKTLNRNVNLGTVGELGWDRVVFDGAKIPAMSGDADRLEVRQIQIKFDPLLVVTKQTLKLDISVISPTVYLDRDGKGNWLNLPPIKPSPPGAFKTEVGNIKIDNGKLILAANPQSPIAIEGINGNVNFGRNQQQLNLNLAGNLLGGGSLQLTGNSAIDRGMTKLAIRGQELVAAKISDLLTIPVTKIDRGWVNGNIEVAIVPDRNPQIMGSLAVKDARISIENVPRTFDGTTGYLQIANQQIKFSNVKTNYDRLSGLVNGVIDLDRGYRLNAKTAVTTLPDVFQTLDIKTPVAIRGAAVGEVELVGKLDRPILNGRFANHTPVQVDRLLTDRVNGRFQLADGKIIINADAMPQVGGKINTQGQVIFSANPTLAFQVLGRDLPGDTLSQVYGFKLPEGMAIGATNFTGLVNGNGDRIDTDLNINASQATYPTTAQVSIDPAGKVRIKSSETRVAGGTVRSIGEISTDRWKFTLQPQAVDSARLATIFGHQLLPEYAGKVSGKVRVSGVNQSCPPTQSNCPNSPLDTLQAEGSFDYQLPAGKVRVDAFQVDRLKWQARAHSRAIDLSKLMPDLPQGIASGSFQLQGDRIDNITPATIMARGTGKLSSPQGGTAIVDRLVIENGKWGGILNLQNLETAQFNPALVGKLTGRFTVGGSVNNFAPQTIGVSGNGKLGLARGGEIYANQLVVYKGAWDGQFTTKNLSLAQFNADVNGKLAGKFNLRGNLDRFTPESMVGNGSGTINLGRGKVTINNLQIAAGKYGGNILFANLQLGKLLPNLDRSLAVARVDGNFNIGGDLDRPDPNSLAAIGYGKLQLGQGKVIARQLQLQQGKWQGDFSAERLPLNLVPSLPLGLQSGKLSGRFQSAGRLDQPRIDRLQLAGAGKIEFNPQSWIASDRVVLGRGNWQGQIKVNNFALARLGKPLPPGYNHAKLTANFDLAGNLAEPNLGSIQGSGNGDLWLNNGRISARNLQLDNGNWQGDIGVNNLSLGTLNPMVPSAVKSGRLFADLRGGGSLIQPDVRSISLTGQAEIKDILGGRIKADRIEIDRGRWQGNVAVDRLALNRLSKFAPNPQMPTMDGWVSGNWQLAGNLNDRGLTNLKMGGMAELNQFQVGELKFNSRLGGEVSAELDRGVHIALTGSTDRLNLDLDRHFQPQTFDIKQQGIIATGTLDRQILNINIQKLPISTLEKWIPTQAGISPYRLAGSASGNFQYHTNTGELIGREITIVKPGFGVFDGDRLFANFSYRNGRASIDRSVLERDRYQYILSGNINPQSKLFDLKIEVPQGQLADLRNLLQVNNNNDLIRPLNSRTYGTSRDLSRGGKLSYRQSSLKQAFHRQAELQRAQEKEAESESENPLPNIGNLEGDFSGIVAIKNHPRTGFQTSFDLAGTNWKMDRYHLDRIQANGKLGNGLLNLSSLSLGNGETELSAKGNFGLQEQAGEITLKNAPVQWLETFVESPIDLEGGVNLNAKIAGNIFDPQIIGKISLSKPQLNQTNLSSAEGNFSYQDSRLNFDSHATFTDTSQLDRDRISIVGSLPFHVPFLFKPPQSQDIKIDIDLVDRGMQIIDVLSKKQFQWIDGQGNINVKIIGKVDGSGKVIDLSANGEAQIDRATIKSAAIEEPIKNVNGQIIFDFDRLDVQKLSGDLSQGKIEVAGLLPISEFFAIDPSQRLKVNMRGITFNLPDKYQGKVDSNLILRGTALNPTLSGNLTLSNGRVLLPDSSSNSIDVINGLPSPTVETPTSNNAFKFKNFQVVLGENLQIDRPPILSFLAKGKIDLDGSIDSPRPFGQVQLQKGAVNLFTTQFRLASGYPQTADFFPTLGADPVLNLRLQAKALESNTSPLANRNSIARSAKGGEIGETADFYSSSLGSVQTVQVEAKISGLASQIDRRLELSSTPPRTQSEIFLLLGGGLLERLGGSDGNVGLGIVNLAGSTLLNSIQDRISDVLSLSDFRLFPTVTKESKTSSGSTLGIAAEVGLDLTPSLSTSIFKIITNTELPQYSLRYRIDERILLRGSTNMFDDNRATIELEQRF